MPRFERLSPARPDRSNTNPFTGASTVLPGRPASRDFIVLTLADAKLERVRGARTVDGNRPLFDEQRRLINYSSADEARACFQSMVTDAHANGYRDVDASDPLEGATVHGKLLDPRTEEVDSFVEGLVRVPWFVNLGVVGPNDASVVRIHAFDDWPGPEDPTAELMADRFVRWSEELEEAPVTPELRELERLVDERVVSRASWNVDFDPSEDPYHAPSACVMHASVVATLVTRYLFVDEMLPDELVDLWLWFARGHWPCAYHSSSSRTRGKLIVL